MFFLIILLLKIFCMSFLQTRDKRHRRWKHIQDCSTEAGPGCCNSWRQRVLRQQWRWCSHHGWNSLCATGCSADMKGQSPWDIKSKMKLWLILFPSKIGQQAPQLSLQLHNKIERMNHLFRSGCLVHFPRPNLPTHSYDRTYFFATFVPFFVLWYYSFMTIGTNIISVPSMYIYELIQHLILILIF